MKHRSTRRSFGQRLIQWSASVTLLTSTTAQAQIGGGMGGGMGGGPPGGAPRCPASDSSPPPPSITMVQVFASERLRALGEELALGPVARGHFERYAATVLNLLEAEVQSALSVRALPQSSLVALGNRIDEAASRLLAWEEVLEAARNFLNALTPAQRAVAEPRMVVSVDPRHWRLPNAPEGASARPIRDQQKSPGLRQ